MKKAILAVSFGTSYPDMVMTDRGAQFVSRDFHAMMEDWGIRHSMSRPRTPVDNRIYYCNNLRPHSSLGYLPPLAA